MTNANVNALTTNALTAALHETIARKLERESGSWDGEYARPLGCELRALGGVCLESSNDGAGNGSWSHSPTELWEFPDGSQLEVAFSDCGAV